MTQLQTFATELEELEQVLETNLITENNTEYAQIIWNGNPADSAIEIHNIHKQYETITQVSPSKTLRQNNPDDDSKFTQYYTLK